jgi:hypothetical protein
MMIAQLVLVCGRFVGLNARLRADAGFREGRPVSHVTRNTGLVVLAACLAALLATSVRSVSAADETSLSGVKLMPSSGDTNVLFTFMIVYRGTAAPTARDLYLDSKCYAMKSAGAAPGGGIMYTYQTKLAAGTHKYRFRFLVGTVNLFMPGTPARTSCRPRASPSQESCAVTAPASPVLASDSPSKAPPRSRPGRTVRGGTL